MANKSKFSNLLLNPGLSYNVDEDGNDLSGESKARIVGALEGYEGVEGSGVQGISKLRAKTAKLLADEDDRYNVKKASRSELNEYEIKDEYYDPSLGKYLFDDGSSDEENISSKKLKTNKLNKCKTEVDNQSNVEELSEADESDDDEDASEDENEELSDDATRSGFSFAENGDFSHYGGTDDDSDEDSNESVEDDKNNNSSIAFDDFDANNSENNGEEEDDSSEEEDTASSGKVKLLDSEEEEEESDDGNVKMVNTSNISDEEKKAEATRKQIELYGRLYGSRIALQKVISSSHGVPQPAVVAGLSEEAQAAKTIAANSASQLLQSLLSLQEAVLNSNPDTKIVLSSKKPAKPVSKPSANDDDEEITSSEDEQDSEDDSDSAVILVAKSPKRTATDAELDSYEERLAKRHCALKPYRDNVVAFWESRTRLLRSNNKSKSSGNLSAFEESFAVTVQRLLMDKDRLVKRTQLRSVRRQNFAPPIGGTPWQHKQEIDEELDIPKANSGSAFEYHDSEIYDDTDFYSRYLEELLKAKMQRGTGNLSAAQFYEKTYNLRKMNKKVVDTKRTRGRKLKHKVHTSIVNFTGMTSAPTMDDDTIDTVVQSIFDKKSGSINEA